VSRAGRRILISGASRGIGLAIALRAARAGARIALLAKTGEPHPTLPGTVFTAAEEIAEAGGEALPIVGDVRSEVDVERAVAATVDAFGGIDACVNNASAIDLSPTPELTMKRFDLIQAVNVRGTFMLSRACIPHLEDGDNPHILTLSPPLNLDPRWLGAHLGYTISKYGMSLCTIGLADELRPRGIAANSLWPRTLIATSAVRNLIGEEQARERARTPEVVADAAWIVLNRPAERCSGNLYVDEDVLREQGVTDLDRYRAGSGEPDTDLFLGPAPR
jgi:citronellol/citronellal dehydrogenase